MPCLSVVTWSSGFTSSSSSLMNFFSWPHILSNLILPLIIYLLFLSTGEQTPARTAGFPWMFTFLWSSCMYFLNLLPFLFIISMSSSCLCLPLTPFSLHYYSITLSVFTPFIGLNRLFTVLQLNFTIVLSCIQQEFNPCLYTRYLCMGMCDIPVHLC